MFDKEIYLHIGYPKCFSTTLQRTIFRNHSQIFYGGIGVPDDISYISDASELLFESVLKYANEHYYQWYKETHVDELTRLINDRSTGKKTVFSSEHLSMNFSFQGIDSTTKYRRLRELFEGYNIHILIIEREPISLIRSLYGEYVKMGYFETYENYLKWLLMFHDRNFLRELNFENKIVQIKSVLGSSLGSITRCSFEEIKKEGVSSSLNRKISEWLNISNESIDTTNENPGLSEKQIENLRLHNLNNRREMGWSQTEPFEKHRNKKLLQTEPLCIQENEIFSNVLQKRKALKNINVESKDVTETLINKKTKILINQIKRVVG